MSLQIVSAMQGIEARVLARVSVKASLPKSQQEHECVAKLMNKQMHA